MSASIGAQSATVSRTATSTTSASLLAATGQRRGFYVANDSAGKLYLLFGTGTASATNYTVLLAAGASYEQHAGTGTYAGPLQGALDTGTGNAQITWW